jgi:SET domain-containing protein
MISFQTSLDELGVSNFMGEDTPISLYSKKYLNILSSDYLSKQVKHKASFSLRIV